MNRAERTRLVKEMAREAGFHHVGAARAGGVETADHFRAWIEAGHHGCMAYLENHLEARVDPRVLLPGARSVVSVALNYYSPRIESGGAGRGKISRYALGDDYHPLVKDRLFQVLRGLEAADPGLEGKCCVDTAPVLDRYWAGRAGVGWIGKHTNLITRDLGSWVFLGELILNRDLDYDASLPALCGSCTRCLDACPTGALLEPYLMDATRCIAYWTIEYRGDAFPAHITKNLDGRVFGCDACQEVCPWNRKFARPTDVEGFSPRPENVSPSLASLSRMEEVTFRRRFRKSPVKRTKLMGFLRNVRHALEKRAGPGNESPPEP